MSGADRPPREAAKSSRRTPSPQRSTRRPWQEAGPRASVAAVQGLDRLGAAGAPRAPHVSRLNPTETGSEKICVILKVGLQSSKSLTWEKTTLRRSVRAVDVPCLIGNPSARVDGAGGGGGAWRPGRSPRRPVAPQRWTELRRP